MKTHTWLTPICCFAAALALTLCLSAADVVDSGECGERVTWTLDSGGILTISGAGAMNDDSYVHYSDGMMTELVQKPSSWAEKHGDSIVSAIIQTSVVNIGGGAFCDCVNLTSVTIPDSVTSIGAFAFEGCASLTSVTIPDSVTSIGYCAFVRCASLTNVTIPDSVAFIGDWAFLACDSLTDIYYSGSPAQWKKVGGNDQLKNATIHYDKTDSDKKDMNLTWTLDSDGVLTISGAGAMDDWEYRDYAPWYGKRDNIVTAVINNGVTSIGSYAFNGCANLTSVTIPDSVASIGDYAFVSCANLTSVTISYGLTSIGEGAFVSCASLTRVTIPDSVTSIGSYAFFGCESLTSVTIPKSVTFICDATFYDCASLTNITIPDGVTSIGDSAFQGCASLTRVTIPDSVISIGQQAFFGCASLTSVTIPDSVTSIGRKAFTGCESLTSVTIPDSVASIGEHAFESCGSLTSVTIPDSVTSIGYGAFSYCASLSAILVASDNRNYMSEGDVLLDKNQSALIWYAMGKTGAYEIPDSVTRIGAAAFRGCANLTSVTIPDSVTSIGYSAFDGCVSLTGVTIPDSVTSIPYGAFSGCAKLTDIYYAGSATQWSEICIYNNNDALKNATIHYNAKDIGIGITLTDENGKIVDGNGQTGETEETKKDAFQEGAELTVSFETVDPDAVTSSGLAVASVFLVFYDKDGLPLSLTEREIDLSNPLNISNIMKISVPNGAKTWKMFMLGDGFDPLRAARMNVSSAA